MFISPSPAFPMFPVYGYPNRHFTAANDTDPLCDMRCIVCTFCLLQILQASRISPTIPLRDLRFDGEGVSTSHLRPRIYVYDLPQEVLSTMGNFGDMLVSYRYH